MDANTVAMMLTDDSATAAAIVERIETHPEFDPEAVLRGTEARLEGYRMSRLRAEPGTVLFAVDATLDELSGASGNGSGCFEAPSIPEARPGARVPGQMRTDSSRTALREGALLRIEATPLGGGLATILISRRDPPTRLLLDRGSLTSLKARQRIVSQLQEDVQTEAALALEELGAEMVSRSGSGRTNSDLQGSAVEFEEIDPWPDPVEGADLLEDLVGAIRSYVVIPEAGAIATVLWIIHTHTLDAADISPILCISSPVKRCGKTTLQCVLRHLVRRPLSASNISGAALFRTIEKHQPTMLLDEADSYLTEREEMRNLLNAGVRRDDAHVYRVVGDAHEPRRFSVFGAKTVSLIGKLPETIQDRSIILPLERKKRTETVRRLRAREAKTIFGPLREMIARWSTDHVDLLAGLEPNIPDVLNDRAADFWEPLLAIADRVGGTWPERARRAAAILSGDDSVPDDSPNIQLLADLRDILREQEGGRIASRTLAESLANLEERPWASWHHGKPVTPNQVSRILRRFGIGPKTLRLPGDDRAKGYALEDCQDAFGRYLPPLPEPGEEGAAPWASDRSVTR